MPVPKVPGALCSIQGSDEKNFSGKSLADCSRFPAHSTDAGRCSAVVRSDGSFPQVFLQRMAAGSFAGGAERAERQAHLQESISNAEMQPAGPIPDAARALTRSPDVKGPPVFLVCLCHPVLFCIMEKEGCLRERDSCRARACKEIPAFCVLINRQTSPGIRVPCRAVQPGQ